MSGWGSKGHTSQGNREYNPDSGDWDFAPVRENSDGSQQHASFFTDAGKPVFTNQVAAGSVATGSGGGGSGPGTAAVTTGGPQAGGTGPGSSRVVASPGFSPGVLRWQTSTAFTDAPEVDGVVNQPLKRIGIGGPQEAMGAISDIGWVRTNRGWTSVPSSDAKERMEDDIFQEGSWMIRNKVIPDLGLVPQPFPNFLGPQSAYTYDFWSSEWRVGGVGFGDAGGAGW